MRLCMLRSTAFFLSLTLLACNGDTPSDTNEPEPGSGGSGAGSRCDQAVARELTCSPSAEQYRDEYVAWCQAAASCWDAIYIPEWVRAYWPCAIARPCGEGDDSCGAAIALDRYENNAVVKADADACIALAQSCQQAGTPFPDDLCASFVLVKTGLRARAAACLQDPCAQVEACMIAVAASEGCSVPEQPEP